MDVLPNTINEFLLQLKKEFSAEALVDNLSPTIFIIHLQGAEVSFVFYRSMHYTCLHTLMSFSHRRVIHLDEDIYLSKKNIVMARIAAILGRSNRIHARKTVLARINKKDATVFQQEHHLQVSLPGKYRYGLFYKGELVSIAVFSGGRKMHEYESSYRSFELLRFCHKSGYLVVGGFSKLIKGFVKAFNPNDIVTYVDRDWSDGENYHQLGFNNIGIIPSLRFYIHPETGLRYSKKEVQGLGAQLTELQQGDTYHRVDNLGSIKMRYII